MINYIKKNFLQIISSVTNPFKKKPAQLLLENKPISTSPEEEQKLETLQVTILHTHIIPNVVSKKYPIARQFPALHFTPQFRPIKKGARRKGLEHIYTSQDGTQKLTAYIWREPDISDQDLFLTICAIARARHRGSVVRHTTPDATNQELRKNLKLDGDGVHMDCLKIKITRYELLKELGYTSFSKKQYEWLEKSLTILSNMNYKYEGVRYITGFRLISWSMDKATDMLLIVINPLTSLSIIGDSKVDGYVLCDLNERQQLGNDIAKALHSILSGLVLAGKTRVFHIDVLCKHVWCVEDNDELTKDTIDHRRRDIKNAIGEIAKLSGWKATYEGRGGDVKITIKRPK